MTVEPIFKLSEPPKTSPTLWLATGDQDFATQLVEVAQPLNFADAKFAGQSVQQAAGEIDRNNPGVLVVDLNAEDPAELNALSDLRAAIGSRIAIIVCIDNFNPELARFLIQLKVSDMVLKPCQPSEMAKALQTAVESVMSAQNNTASDANTDAKIYTFQPVAGGVGNTMLTLQTAALLREFGRTCVVDLNLQQGSCAEYLDLEPRFNLDEVAQDADRLDDQLLNAMISHHDSGIAIIAAPADPAATRSFNANLVTRTLDLAASRFDNVIIDMPRTWFPWTDSVMLGSDQLYLVCELTTPCIRQAQRMLKCVGARTDNQVNPKVIVNRVDNRGAPGCLRAEDAEVVFKEAHGGSISNTYKAVREAIDRGVLLETVDPKNAMLRDLRGILMPEEKVKKSWSISSLIPFARNPMMASASA